MKAPTRGSGWHKESVRHRNARMRGKAGGNYRMQYKEMEYSAKTTPKGLEEKKNGKITYSNTKSYFLDAQNDSRQSFYGKAKVEIKNNGDKCLYSYNTKVAEIKNGKPIVHGSYSSTTTRHIKEFLKQEGYKAESTKQVLKDYGSKDKKDMTYSQLKKKGSKIKPSADSDGDGVKNRDDCRPLNKDAQDDGISKEELNQKTSEFLEKNYEKEKAEEAKTKNKESFFQRTKRAYSELQEEKRARHLKELNSGLKKKVENEEEIDTRTLSDSELHRLAIIEGESLFGENKYEAELKRRIKTEADLNTDLKVERQEAAKAQKERLKEGSGKGFFEGLYD